MARYRKQIAALRGKMRELQRSVDPEEVRDYEFSTPRAGCVSHREYLFVIQNTDAGCRYCTLWADGFNRDAPAYRKSRSFVVAAPDEPAAQHRFKTSRGWRFRMVSYLDTGFAGDMGYRSDKGWLPGVSVFSQRGRTIYRVSDTGFQPRDDFCAIWHLFNLLPEGANGWQPQYTYR